MEVIKYPVIVIDTLTKAFWTTSNKLCCYTCIYQYKLQITVFDMSKEHKTGILLKQDHQKRKSRFLLS